MIKIRGASDDLVEIYWSCYREDEIGCWEADEYNFCPHCMAPMADESVEMVVRRLEALKDE